MAKPVTLIPLADFHTGGTTALHPKYKQVNGKWIEQKKGWHYIHNPHYVLNDRQIKIYNHFEKCLAYAAEKRAGNKLAVLVVGDALDGDHHQTHELATRNVAEQKKTHIQLMNFILQKIAFNKRSDLLAYISGTSVHVGDSEDGIAEELGGYHYGGGYYSDAFVELEINGALIWTFHKGVSAGHYPNRGNSAINFMRRVYYQCRSNNVRPPNLIISAHTHDPLHMPWKMDGHEMHYVILPSWQEKTRYVRDNMPTSINRIGMQLITITGAGQIVVDEPLLLSAPLGTRIRIAG